MPVCKRCPAFPACPDWVRTQEKIVFVIFILLLIIGSSDIILRPTESQNVFDISC